MRKLLVLFLLTLVPVAAVEQFVLFTQQKTGTNFMIPFLYHLTGRNLSRMPYTYSGETCCETFEEWLAESAEPGMVAWSLCNHPISEEQLRKRLLQCRRTNHFLHLHCPYTPNMDHLLRRMDVRVIGTKRDLRDYCVSAAHWSIKKPNSMWPDLGPKGVSIEDRITYVIKGDRFWNGVRGISEGPMEWRHSDNCLLVDFTTLLGPPSKAGVTEEEQISELRKVADFLGVECSDRFLLRCFNRAYGTRYTFRKGTTGQWRELFTEEHKRLFKEEAGDLLIELGYEQSMDW